MTKVCIAIDDEELHRAIIEKIVCMMGFKVYMAKNGNDGLALCDKYKPDLIVLDWMMPHMSGLKFIEEANNRNWRESCKAILCTARGEWESEEEASNYDISAVLIKPFCPSELVNKINEVM